MPFSRLGVSLRVYPNYRTSKGRNLPLYLANKTSSTKELTGSGIATALAADLVAMITYCFKASVLATTMARTQQGRDYMALSELVKATDVDRIAEHNALKKTFTGSGRWRMGSLYRSGTRLGLRVSIWRTTATVRRTSLSAS
ncbi:hypothetical protein QQS21_011554 [Conoideocrella luteorostrata]|uniref:Uncharacterized protein n=1 Tax=Conoideocrella luteorostrata TaxID=1105319 RepID=A0AAJ0CF82_9HYPO|nr:hypothetical protein QQS21_011554 [Conoideocrella luteorostrata]